MNYCSKCGEKLTDGVKYCSRCGNKIDGVNDNVNQNTYQDVNQTYYPNGIITRREIAIAVILSIVTLGIYSIYWFVVMTDDVNRLSDEGGTSGGMAFLFSLLTCGLYMFYWHYKMGKQMYKVGMKYNVNISDNSIIYLVLSLFGFGIINYCLIQNDLNKFA